MQVTTFADLGVSEPVVRALAERGIKTPFAIQEMVIGDVLSERDVLVKSPTGSGKTLAFGVPLVDLTEAGGYPSTLVLAPTRELATQIVEELRAVARSRSVNIVAVYGGVAISPQIKAVKSADILVATPGRLIDLLDRRAVRLDHIEALVLDEADRMLDMGFKPAVDRIVRETPRQRQTLLFSATLEGEVARLARDYTVDAVRHEYAPTVESRGNTEHRFLRVAHEAKGDELVRVLREDGRGRTLVFVRTKRGADRLAKRLAKRNVQAVAMHGDKSQGQRERALSSFESGKIPTLIATDVAARGIDVADITHVVNYDLPGAAEDYVHRVGRTARAGATGVGVTFVLDDQAIEAVKMGTGLGLERELAAAGLHAPRPSANGGNGGNRSGRRRRR
ncbi:MAG: ATP-dependent helicase RhlE [Solirubrobacteraceae bacterium]|nr:ATP-dependent helicase RhlE [Solirubrobacteraceae bacterium]